MIKIRIPPDMPIIITEAQKEQALLNALKKISKDEIITWKKDGDWQRNVLSQGVNPNIYNLDYIRDFLTKNKEFIRFNVFVNIHGDVRADLFLN